MQEMWSLGREDPLGEEMATHSSSFVWEIHGQRSLVGYSPWGLKVGYDWAWAQAWVAHSRGVQPSLCLIEKHFFALKGDSIPMKQSLPHTLSSTVFCVIGFSYSGCWTYMELYDMLILSLSIIFSSFIHVVAGVSMSLLFINISLMNTLHLSFTHQLVGIWVASTFWPCD